MPKGPQGQKRPADVIGEAIRVAKLATGELEEKPEKANEYARLGGQIGGRARAENLSAGRRSQIAKLAAKARWKNSRKQKP